MSERGFIPMSAAAVLMLLIAIAFAAQAMRYGISRSDPESASAHELICAGSAVRSQINWALRCAGYRAMYEVSSEAWKFSRSERLRMMEGLTLRYLSEGLMDLSSCDLFDSRLKLELNSPPQAVSFTEKREGDVQLTAIMPESARLNMTSSDGMTRISMPLEDISATLDSRYFLLQDLMDNFVNRLGDANTYWGAAEYLAAWSEAWGTGIVKPNTGRSTALFETAWALHEMNVLGSADCSAWVSGAVQSLISLPQIQFGLEYLYELEGWMEDSLEKISDLERGIDEALGLLNDALGCAENRAIFIVENAAEKLTSAIDGLLGLKNAFRLMVDHGAGDALSERLISGLVEGIPGSDLSPSEQLISGFDGLIEKLERAVESLESATFENGMRHVIERVACDVENILMVSGAVRSLSLRDALGNLNSVPVYVDSPRDSTLPRLRSLLERMSGEMEELKSIVDFPGELTDLFSELRPSQNAPDREDLFSIFPSEPLRKEPGVSAYHNLRVSGVSYSREDLAGLAGSQMATPVPLWFIGVTVWWGQWESTLDLDEGSVETIFDCRNRTVPAVTKLGGAHVPLGYRWEFDDEFRIRVVVASLRPFAITFDRAGSSF
ncbi:MAG: hypothetical protein QXG10_00035 [Candidatus Hadarchaeales archaeon]